MSKFIQPLVIWTTEKFQAKYEIDREKKTPPDHLINTIEYLHLTIVLNKHRNRSEPVQKRFDFISFH